MSVIATDHQKEALDYRREGYSYKEIGKMMGISPQCAHKAAMKALRALQGEVAELADEVRSIELDRLDALQLKFYEKALLGDAEALRSVLSIMEKRMKLVPGLEAATAKTVNVRFSTMTDDELLAEARRLGVNTNLALPAPNTTVMGAVIEAEFSEVKDATSDQ